MTDGQTRQCPTQKGQTMIHKK